MKEYEIFYVLEGRDLKEAEEGITRQGWRIVFAKYDPKVTERGKRVEVLWLISRVEIK